ncbi:MAG: beta-ketoacyl-ACP synthase II [Actinobacteria bacterium]|nr:MAG: beta-ketoacyl-ACP synthase II [Actinomycetota bacterium]
MSCEQRRVVVTGLGAVTPLGADLGTSWRRLLAGESGAGPLTAFPADGQPVRIACEASEFEPERWLDRQALDGLDRVAHFAVAAARMAEADAGLQIAGESERVGASIGTAQGGLSSLESSYGELLERGRIEHSWVEAFLPNMAAAAVSLELGTHGPLGAPCTACAASAMAIGDGYDAIRLGRAEVMLCGGSEAGISELSLAGFAALRALSRRNQDPGRASRPFDAGRDGFVMGEGAAVLVLEEAEHARARGARVYAELAGYGLSSDSFHITDPDPLGEGGARAIAAALADAGIAPEQVDYVNAHATSTPIGDELEARALQLALGEEKARTTPTSSTKGATGHCLGAAGAIEAAFTALAVAENVAPPTINHEQPDPRCALDCVPNQARRLQIQVALSNSLGFGGHNAALILQKYPPIPAPGGQPGWI